MVGTTSVCCSYSLVAGVFLGFRGLQPARRRVVHGASWPFGRRSTPAAFRPDSDRPLAHPQEKAHVENRQPHALVQRRHQPVGSGSGARDSNGPVGLHSSGTTTPWRARTFTILGSP
jgi:hypothetical protein